MGRLTVNTVFLTLEKSAHLLGSMLVMVAVARLLGEGTLAVYAFVIGLTAFFVPILDAGLNNRVIKATASGNGHGSAAVSEALAYKLTLALPTVALMAGAAWFSTQATDVLVAVVLVGVSTVAISIGDAFNSGLKGVQRPAYSAALVGGLNVGLLVTCLVATAQGTGLIGVSACFALCRVGYAVAAAGVLARVSPATRPGWVWPVRRDDVVDGLKHLSSIYFLGNLLHINYITTYVTTSQAVSAEFAIGYRAAGALMVLSAAGLEAVLPHVTERFQGEGYGRGSLVRTFGIYGGIGLAVAMVTQLAAGPAVWLVFGGHYGGAVAPVRVLAWSVPGFVICGLGHTVLMGMDRHGGSTAVMLGLFVAGAAAGVVAAEWRGVWATAWTPTAVGAVFAVVLSAMAWRRARPGISGTDTASRTG